MALDGFFDLFNICESNHEKPPLENYYYSRDFKSLSQGKIKNTFFPSLFASAHLVAKIHHLFKLSPNRLPHLLPLKNSEKWGWGKVGLRERGDFLNWRAGSG
jgi:hypothetical protein